VIGFEVQGGTATADLDDDIIDDLIDNAVNDTVVLDFSNATGATEASLPTDALEQFADADLGVSVVLPGGTITLDADALQTLTEEAGGVNVSLSLQQMDTSIIPPEQTREVRGSDILFNITITSDDEPIKEFYGTLTITVPWNGNPHVMVWYLTPEGMLERKDTTYCHKTRTVTFTTTHLSIYVVGDAINPFTDMSADDWFYDAAIFSYAAGIIHGMTPTIFGADTTLTRGMVVTILYRHAGQPRRLDDTILFPDVTDGAWYFDSVRWARINEIVLGHSDGTFKPYDTMTREQFAAVLYRYAVSLGLELPDIVTDVEYADWDNINTFAQEAVEALTKAGVFQDINMPDGNFNPKDYITRAEAVSALYRLLEL